MQYIIQIHRIFTSVQLIYVFAERKVERDKQRDTHTNTHSHTRTDRIILNTTHNIYSQQSAANIGKEREIERETHRQRERKSVCQTDRSLNYSKDNTLYITYPCTADIGIG